MTNSKIWSVYVDLSLLKYDDDDDDDNDYLDRLMVPSPLTRSSPDPLWRPSLVKDTRFRMLEKFGGNMR